MNRHIIPFTTLTIAFVGLAFMVKSKFYYLPYPNLVDYFFVIVLLVTTIISLFLKTNAGFKTKLVMGFSSIVFLMVAINLMNLVLEWHPPTLNPPLIKSQSFEVDYEPYVWQTVEPNVVGYDHHSLSSYLRKIESWGRLRALLVVKDDKVVIEHYSSGATKYSAFNVHSITKSITGSLVGLAIQKGIIKSENESVLSYFPEHSKQSDSFKQALTIKHLLSMRGGWVGGDGIQTAEACISQENLYVMPDTEFKYFTGSQNILSTIITKSTGGSTKEFAESNLFQPLGIHIGFWRKDAGYYCGGDESYYTARDLARFGQLFLNNGVIDGRVVLDSTWINKTFTNYTAESKAFRSLDCYDEVGYGYCWWLLNTKENTRLFTARGKGGQHLILIPDKNVIIVVLQEWNPFKKDEAVEHKFMAELLSIL